MEGLVSDFISKNKLFDHSQKILLAVSGGLDSMVLCYILKKLNYNIAVAHCNYQLRDIDSDLDQLFVENNCKSNQIDCFSIKFDTQKIVNDQKKGIQEVARNLRYQYFDQLLILHHFDVIATAHHLNDSIETMLFNFVKGTALSGMVGIKARRNQIVRPLLGLTRAQILEYATIHRLKWREDESNKTDKYSRNLIRNKITPVLKAINPGLEDTLKISSDKFDQFQQIFKQQLEDKKEAYLIKIGYNNFKLNFGLFPVEIFELINQFGFSYNQCVSISNYQDHQKGVFYESNLDYFIIKESDCYVLGKKESDQVLILINDANEEVVIENEWKMKFKTVNQIPFNFSNNMICVPFNNIVFPLKIRNWQEKDRFVPFGMKNGSQLVSDFLTNQKISNHNRKSVKVLLNNSDEIIWLIGYRMSHKYKCQDNDKILMILIEK